MGFMDRMKQGMESAQEAQKMAASGAFGDLQNQPMPTSADMDEANKLAKLNNSGIERTATVKSLAPTGATNPGGGLQHSITVDVEAGDAGEGYEATFQQYLVDVQMPSLVVGNRIIVRVDPDDPNSMIFWSVPQ